MSFNEIKQHGTHEFPFELYNVTQEHPRYIMVRHWHSAIEIIHVVSGTLTVYLDERTYEAKPGDIFLANSGVIHGATPHECFYQCMAFEPAFLRSENEDCNRFLDGLLAQEFALPEVIIDEDMRSIILQLINTMNTEKNGFRFYAIGLCAHLFAIAIEKELYARAYVEDKNKQNIYRLKGALKFVRENFKNDITLEDIARESGLSTKYFCSFFRKMTGIPPVKFLMTYRIEHAARELVGSDNSITQIAYECGFNDLSYFIKTFKEMKGVTPKQYRKA